MLVLVTTQTTVSWGVMVCSVHYTACNVSQHSRQHHTTEGNNGNCMKSYQNLWYTLSTPSFTELYQADAWTLRSCRTFMQYGGRNCWQKHWHDTLVCFDSRTESAVMPHGSIMTTCTSSQCYNTFHHPSSASILNLHKHCNLFNLTAIAAASYQFLII